MLHLHPWLIIQGQGRPPQLLGQATRAPFYRESIHAMGLTPSNTLGAADGGQKADLIPKQWYQLHKGRCFLSPLTSMDCTGESSYITLNTVRNRQNSKDAGKSNTGLMSFCYSKKVQNLKSEFLNLWSF